VERTTRGRTASAASGRRLDTSIDRLTPAEERVLNRAIQGMSTRQIASELFVSEATVRTHLTRIYEKRRVRNRLELIAAEAAGHALSIGRGASVSSLATSVEQDRPTGDSPAWSSAPSPAGIGLSLAYLAGLIAASGPLVYLTPLSPLFGPSLLIGAWIAARRGTMVAPAVRSAALIAGLVLSAEQLAVLVALRTL